MSANKTLFQNNGENREPTYLIPTCMYTHVHICTCTHTHTHLKNQNNLALENFSSAGSQRNTILSAQKDPSFIGMCTFRWPVHHDEVQGEDTKRTEGHVKSLAEAWQEEEVVLEHASPHSLWGRLEGKPQASLGTDAGLFHREHCRHPPFLTYSSLVTICCFLFLC